MVVRVGLADREGAGREGAHGAMAGRVGLADREGAMVGREGAEGAMAGRVGKGIFRNDCFANIAHSNMQLQLQIPVIQLPQLPHPCR